MRGSIKIASRWCRRCKRRVAAQANSTVWGCGDLVLVLLSLGLWVPVRIVLMILTNPWRCPECGRRI
jgi:hypothetical protein